MAINLTSYQAALQAKLDAVTTDEKEMLLLGKAVEATIGNIAITDIQTEGTTQVNATNLAGTTNVGNVNTAGSTQVGNVNTEGNTQVGLVTAEGTTQTNLITAQLSNKADTTYVDSEIANIDGLPSRTSNSGKFLTNDGTNASWAEVAPEVIVAASDPASPSTGLLVFNTSEESFKVYNGTSWVAITFPPMEASGGSESLYSGYKSHTFTSSGTFTVNSAGDIDLMIIAGGGAGGGDNGGGGGAGGVVLKTSLNVSIGTYSIVIGAGNSGGSGGYGSPSAALSGNNSVAFGLTAIAGGGGMSAGNNGLNGGSGGGAGQNASGGSGTVGQGFDGGDSTWGASAGGAGGGGAGERGDDETSSTDRPYGGDGLQNNYRTGINQWYAGGGGGGMQQNATNAGFGGQGGGGNGAVRTGDQPNWETAMIGAVNTGSGGGGGGQSTYGGPGGSGIVVIRYAL